MGKTVLFLLGLPVDYYITYVHEWWAKILSYSPPPIGERLANAEKD